MTTVHIEDSTPEGRFLLSELSWENGSMMANIIK